MQPLHQKSPLFESGLPLLLTVGIFVLDLSAPAGIDLWLLYAVPFTLIAVSSLGQIPRYFLGLVALLVLIGPVVSPVQAGKRDSNSGVVAFFYPFHQGVRCNTK